MTKEECYKILGVKQNSTQEQVVHSYKRLLKKYHPDTFQGDKKYATEKTMQIVSAYNFLMENNNFSKNNKQKLKQENKKETLKKQNKKTQKATKENISRQEKTKQKKQDKNTIKKPKYPIMAIDGDVIAIVVLSIILVVLLIIFATV